jgi:hypothetical protein
MQNGESEKQTVTFELRGLAFQPDKVEGCVKIGDLVFELEPKKKNGAPGYYESKRHTDHLPATHGK